MGRIIKFNLFENKSPNSIVSDFYSYHIKEKKDNEYTTSSDTQIPKESKELKEVKLRAFKDPKIREIYKEYMSWKNKLDKLHNSKGHKAYYTWVEPSSKINIEGGSQLKEWKKLLRDVKETYNLHEKWFEEAYEFSKYIPDSYWKENNLNLWDIVDSEKGLVAMRDNYKKMGSTEFMDYYRKFGKNVDPNNRVLSKQEIEKIKNSGGKTKIGRLGVEDMAKDFYYNFIKAGKSCTIDSKKDKNEAFEEAKKNGCNYFKWKEKWYNTETDMPIDQELKAYRDKEFPHNVVVDYFPMGQAEAGGYMGHIQAWSLDEPKYQINAMPAKAGLSAIVGPDPKSILRYSSGEKVDTTMYNQKVDELNKLDKESIVIKMNDSEYENFKRKAGDWAGKAHTEVSKAVVGGTNKTYNVLFSNCSHHTLKGVLPLEKNNEVIKQAKLTANTLPLVAYDTIKRVFSGRFVERKKGIRLVKLDNVEGVPSEYESAEYVIKNAETVVANKWTLILQKTLWKQKDNLEKESSSKPEYKNALDALENMYKTSINKKDASWDRTFKKGGDTDKALIAMRKAIDAGYKPVNL